MLQAASAVRGTVPPAIRPAGSSSLLLTENQQWIGGPPPLMDKLTQRERELGSPQEVVAAFARFVGSMR